MTMQFLGLLAASLTLAAINTWYTLKFEDTPGSLSFGDLMDQSWPRIIVVLLYCLVDFSLYMGLIHHLRTSKASYLSLQQLSASCTGYGSLLLGFVYVQSPHSQLPKVSNPNSIITSAADMRTSIHNIGIIIGYFLAAVACLIILYYILKKIWRLACTSNRTFAHRLLNRCHILLVTIGAEEENYEGYYRS
jgi:hypothetical protein